MLPSGPFIAKELFGLFRAYETRKHILNYLFWECTTRCNINCLHCGSDCSKDSSIKDMPASDFYNVLDTIKAPRHTITIVITGGEPLLRNDLEACGIEIRKRGFRWGIVSNAMLYTPERHNSLLNAGMGALTISLDGMESNHNWLRNNKNAFAKANIAIPLATGSPRLQFDVVTCINKRNISELNNIYLYLLKNKVKAWRLFCIAPIGRASNNKEFSLSPQEFKSLLNFITEKRKEHKIDVKFSCEGYLGTYENKARGGYFFCRAGINIASVLIDGSIGACPNINRSFIQGNIYNDNFINVWQNKFQIYRQRTWRKKGICASCADFRYCLGNGFHLSTNTSDDVLICHKKLIDDAT